MPKQDHNFTADIYHSTFRTVQNPPPPFVLPTLRTVLVHILSIHADIWHHPSAEINRCWQCKTGKPSIISFQ